jgi:hypothetical protein
MATTSGGASGSTGDMPGWAKGLIVILLVGAVFVVMLSVFIDGLRGRTYGSDSEVRALRQQVEILQRQSESRGSALGATANRSSIPQRGRSAPVCNPCPPGGRLIDPYNCTCRTYF